MTFNNTLEILDLSKNAFSDNGFIDFGRQLGHNKGLQNLNLSKNKDISDEVGLRQLAHSLIANSSLHEIDLSGLKIRKNCIESYFKPALKHNITLKKIEGKIPHGVIEQDLHDNELIEKEKESFNRAAERGEDFSRPNSNEVLDPYYQSGSDPSEPPSAGHSLDSFI